MGQKRDQHVELLGESRDCNLRKTTATRRRINSSQRVASKSQTCECDVEKMGAAYYVCPCSMISTMQVLQWQPPSLNLRK